MEFFQIFGNANFFGWVLDKRFGACSPKNKEKNAILGSAVLEFSGEYSVNQSRFIFLSFVSILISSFPL